MKQQLSLFPKTERSNRIAASRLKKLAPLVALSLVLAGCSGGSDSDPGGAVQNSTAPELQTLYEAAQEAGESSVSVLASVNEADYSDPSSGLGYVGAQFEAEFPEISIEWTGILGSGIFANLDGQSESGNYTTDVVMTGTGGGVLNHQADQDRFMSYAPATAEVLGDESRGPDNTYTVGYSSGIGMIYNTSMYEESELPQTLDELLSPAWAGKFGMTEPNGSWPADIVLASLGLADEISEGEIETLLTNAELYQDMPTALNALAQGRTGVLLWVPLSVAMNMQRTGAPVGLAEMDTMFLQRNGLGIAAEAPHENAAKLFVEWIFTENGQAALAEGWFSYGEMPDAPDRDGMPPASAFTVPQIPVYDEASVREQFFADTVKSILESVK